MQEDRADPTDRIVVFPVVMQRQVPTIQTEEKTAEVPQIQYPDRVVDVPCRPK